MLSRICLPFGAPEFIPVFFGFFYVSMLLFSFWFVHFILFAFSHFYFVIKHFSSTIPPIATKQTITSHIKSLNTKTNPCGMMPQLVVLSYGCVITSWQLLPFFHQVYFWNNKYSTVAIQLGLEYIVLFQVNYFVSI